MIWPGIARHMGFSFQEAANHSDRAVRARRVDDMYPGLKRHGGEAPCHFDARPRRPPKDIADAVPAKAAAGRRAGSVRRPARQWRDS
jgi:hypothetical protein